MNKQKYMDCIVSVLDKVESERHIRDFDVAKETGLQPCDISRWRAGIAPSLSKLIVFCDYAGVSLDFACGRSIAVETLDELETEIISEFRKLSTKEKVRIANELLNH